MDAIKGNIFSILNGNKQFQIPVYQRIYNWDIAQCSRLWRDIVEMQKKGKHGHFVGSIVNIAENAMPTGVQSYMIIDGQQRLTTLTLLLISLRDYAIAHPEDKTINYKRIDSMLLKNEYESGDDQYKLLLTETDRELLISLIERKPIAEDKVSKILKNYNFFADKISKNEITPAEVYESIGKLQIVNITLERDVDDAQAIFESLNSTGKELSQSDLIRNYILMGLNPKDMEYIYSHIWRPMEKLFGYENQSVLMDKFFRDYLTMKLARIPKIDNVYEEFKAYHLNCEFSTLQDFCRDLYKHAKYYTDIIFAKSSEPELSKVYSDINSLKMEVVYPFLLKVHSDYEDRIITLENLIEIMNICISYVFRRAVCDIPTNSLNKTFATLRNEIKTDDYVNSVKAFFILRDDYKEFPDDEKFSAAFVGRDIYNMRMRNFILSHLENYQSKNTVIVENLTIEHIMPQNKELRAEWQAMLGADWRDIQKKYLHTIGNLTLTAYNPEMSDRPFAEKMNMEGGFKQSALRLNSYVITADKWTEEEIKQRANILAEKAIRIWAYPALTDEQLKPYIVEDKPEDKYSLTSYDTNIYTMRLFDELDKRILNLSPSVKREFKKLYIAYKLDTNFVDIVFQKSRLRLSLNMKFSEIIDPKGLCRDITGIGRWGNGDVEIFMEPASDKDYIMYLITQAYELQAD